LNLLGKKREIMFMNLSDLRYIDIPIISEEDKGFATKKVEKNISHFWKGGPGWTGKKLRYLGCKGHPIVSWIQEAEEVVQGTIKEYLEFAWGEQAYANMPQELREAIETEMGVIVTVKPDISADLDTKYTIDRLQAEEMLTDTTQKNLGSLGQHEEKKPFVQSLGEKIPWMAIGALIIYVFLHNNVIR